MSIALVKIMNYTNSPRLSFQLSLLFNFAYPCIHFPFILQWFYNDIYSTQSFVNRLYVCCPPVAWICIHGFFLDFVPFLILIIDDSKQTRLL